MGRTQSVLLGIVAVHMVSACWFTSCRKSEGKWTALDSETERAVFGLRVTIRDEERKRLYVALAAWSLQNPQRGKDGEGYARAQITVDQGLVPPPGVQLFCGRRPDFQNLVMLISIWEMPEGATGPLDIMARKPDFAAIVRRADFDFSQEGYLYVPFAEVERQSGRGFRLIVPASYDEAER